MELKTTETQLKQNQIELGNIEKQRTLLITKEKNLHSEFLKTRQDIEVARQSNQSVKCRDELAKRLLMEKEAGRIPGIYVKIYFV